ncbi:MAG: hypothetical protein Q8Q59_08325 [Luteolibacter sp.]|jgi:hypothetical protein|nr:hypothetical protein [Luteolibacter sp.]
MSPETPFTIALSRDEMIALIRFHSSKCRAIPKKLGQESLKLSLGPFPKMKEMKALHDAAKNVLTYHSTRARGILSIIKPD